MQKIKISNIIIALIALCAGLQAQVTVVNGASGRIEQPVAAGSWATAYGSFTGVAQETATAFPLPTSLGGVSVTVDGADAPVYFVRADQINFLIPLATTSGVKSISINTGSATIAGTVRVSSAGPGLFVDFSDTGNPISGRVLNENNTVNGPANPASRGSVVQIFGTGPGALDLATPDGAAPGSPNPLTVSTPQVFLGGQEVEVGFSGLNADAPGLWQINATIPAGLLITGRVPVAVYIDGVDSNEVSIFVQ